MSDAQFERVLKAFLPHRAHFRYLTLHGGGEPLLDPALPERVRLAKEMGFRGLGFASNCTHLSESVSRRLLSAGLDTIICSVDGVDKATHESIRVGADFDRVCDNIRGYIRLRDEMDSPGRVLVRFIRQKTNHDQWPAFREHWQRRLDAARGDDVLVFDAHDWAGSLDSDATLVPAVGDEGPPSVCDEIWKRIFVRSDTRIQLCCVDAAGQSPCESVLQRDPIEIYNDDPFRRYRQAMRENRMGELTPCKTCSLPRSQASKTKTADAA